jgi:hypothetical protein
MTSATHHHPSRRDMLSDLTTRLMRVQAAGNTVASLTSVPGTSSAMLVDALQSLEHDLLLATREAGAARERISR